MRYKKSQYNILIDKVENNDLLYNSLSGAYVLLDKESKAFYDNIEDLGDNLTEKNLSYLNSMLENSIIVDADIDELKLIKIFNNNIRYNSSDLLLTIAPTMNCNMACPYCYEKKEASKMTDEVIKALVEFVKYRLEEKGYKSLNISWYGGEPLLATDVIYKLSEEFIYLCDNMKIAYNASMVSNGTLLSENTANKLFNDCKVNSIQVTLDGMPETNNKRRILKNNQGSFDIIIKNIKAASKFLNISVRSNVDKENVNEVSKLISYFRHENLIPSEKLKLYFAPVTSSTEACKSISSSCLSMKEFSEIQKDIYDKLYTELGITPNFPNTSIISCPATGLSSFVIDSTGLIYRCWDEIENKAQSIGNVKDGLIINKRFIDWLELELPEKCNNCKLLPVCHAGCPFVRLQSKGNDIECSHSSYLINHVLKLYYDNYSKEKVQNA